MTTSRRGEAYQAKYVQQMKTNIQKIVNGLNTYAGKSGKPDYMTDAINELSRVFNKYLRDVAENRRWESQFVTLWTRFWRTWKDGEGSWTDSLKVAKQLNVLFRNVEP